MSDFIIPKGKDFEFTVTIMEKDTLLTQDVQNFNTTNSEVKFRELATMTCVAGNCTLEKVPDDSTASPLTYKGGRIKVTVPSSITANMNYERGEKVDGYYLKPTYEGIITIAFTDSTPTRTVLLENIYVIPATC